MQYSYHSFKKLKLLGYQSNIRIYETFWYLANLLTSRHFSKKMLPTPEMIHHLRVKSICPSSRNFKEKRSCCDHAALAVDWSHDGEQGNVLNYLLGLIVLSTKIVQISTCFPNTFQLWLVLCCFWVFDFSSNVFNVEVKLSSLIPSFFFPCFHYLLSLYADVLSFQIETFQFLVHSYLSKNL